MFSAFRRPKVTLSQDVIQEALADLHLLALNVSETNGKLLLSIELPEDANAASLEKTIYNRLGKENVQLLMTRHHAAPQVPERKAPSKAPSKIQVRGVKKIIAVASGKGGVGKSTIAAGLACALAAHGLKVGLLDADIYGPSVPKLMGLEGRKPDNSEEGIIPLTAHKVSVMSIGFMIDAAKPLIWRGPMVQSAFKQLLSDVHWGHKGDLDVLVLDTPPGTGDVQLTLAQSLDVDGAVIVTTPQEIALLDARKGVAMFQQLNVPIIGLIENMSGDIFGVGGGERAAEVLNIPFLGYIPLDANIRRSGDEGMPKLDSFEKFARLITERLHS